MKKISLTLALLAITIGGSFAQKLDIRAYGGMNILQLSSDVGENNINNVFHDRRVQGRPGVQVGLAATFGSRFFVQPGLQYSLMSTKVIHENQNNGNSFTDETTIKMISIPLKVGVRLINPDVENIVNVRLFGGFDGYHVTKVNHGTKSGNINNISEDDYSNLIINADFGLGIDILFLYLDLGYQLGLNQFHSGSDDAKGNMLYGNLGLRFSF